MKKPNVQRKKTWHIMKGKDLNEKQKIYSIKRVVKIYFFIKQEKNTYALIIK